MLELEAAAKELAASCGRDWGDMGTYERQDFLNEAGVIEDVCRDENAAENARRYADDETPLDAIRHFLTAVDRGWLGQMPSDFNDSAFVHALREHASTPSK